MCTPSLAVSWSCTVAAGGFGRSFGTLAGQLVGFGCAGVGHALGVAVVVAGPGAAFVPVEDPEPPHAVSATARAARARRDAPRLRSMQRHPSVSAGLRRHG